MPLFTSLTAALLHRATQSQQGITFIDGPASALFYPYRALLKDAAHALGFLQQQGVQVGAELIIQLEDNQHFLIAFWACILGGIVPVPLAIGNTEEHHKKLLATWQVLQNPYFLSTQKNLPRAITFLESQHWEGVAETLEQRSFTPEDLLNGNQQEGEIYPARPNDIAFIQFSSGSTGLPKGVVLTHHNLLVNLDAIASSAAYAYQDALLSWMPLTHDMGLIGFHLNPLYNDLNQYLIPTTSFVRRPSLWLDAASIYGATVLCSPNFGYEYTLKHLHTDPENKWDFSKVRIIYNGAEPIAEKLCQRFLTALEPYGLKRTAMCPVYGLAEASLAVSMSTLENEVESIILHRGKIGVGDEIVQLTADAEDAISVVNLGKPINDCTIEIRDDEEQTLSAQMIGHIYIKGAAVTSGYYYNPRATAETCKPDGWLRTGDLGFMQQGCLYVTGRAKDVFFVNGQNFYPHDIENLALEVPEIELNKIAIAGSFNHHLQKEEVFAFVFYRGPREAFLPIAQNLSQHLSHKIGLQFKHIIPVKDMPRTTSGKLQRFKLLERYYNGAYAEVLEGMQAFDTAPVHLQKTSASAPNAPQLLQIWQTVLGRKDLDLNANFLAYTGSSLKVAEMLMQVHQVWNVEISIEKVYANPTITGLLAAIQAISTGSPALIPVAHLAHYPATPNQKRLYYQWLGQPKSTAYNIPVAFTLSAAIDAQKLEQCLHILIQRHDSLRLRFELIEEELFFVVKPEASFRLDVRDVQQERKAESFAELVQPFDLHTHPLIRCTYFHAPTGVCSLFFDFHHIIADGVSIHLFVQELLSLYNGEQLAPLPLGFKDYATWQNELVFPAQKIYWQQRLEEKWPLLDLPLDQPRPLYFDTRGGKLFFDVEPALTAQLIHLAKQQACTLHSLLLTVYKILLVKYTGQKEVSIGIPVAGRRHSAVQQVLGMFVNTLVVHRPVSEDETFAELLSAEQKHLLELLENQDLPFGELVGLNKVQQDPGRHPMFDTMFIYQNMGSTFAALGAAQVQRFPFDPGFAKYDLSMEVFEGEGELQVGIEYATRLFYPQSIERMAGHFVHLLQQIVAEPAQTWSKLDLVNIKERIPLLEDFNRTKADYPATTSIQTLIEQQAQLHPDRIALECGQAKISYQQLNEQAEALAQLLQQRGLAAGEVGAIYLPRSPELIVAILAILKTGATYLPIDTILPPERIKYMLEHSRSKLLLTFSTQATKIRPLQAELPRLIVLNLDQQTWKSTGAVLLSKEKIQAPAYIIYTSGTTGNPKGVVVGQRSLVNYCLWAAKNYIKHPEAVFPLFTSVSFDLTITSIFVPLISGNKIIIYGEEEAGSALEAILYDNHSTVLKLTPSHLRLLSEHSLAVPLDQLKLKCLIVGGEKLDTQVARTIDQLFGGKVTIVNEYGPTEATVGCMIYQYSPEDDADSVPIGRPADNAQIYLLDPYQKLVPQGVVGELYISGDCLALGYLHDEATTTAKFIDNPFVPGTRMYKTGDKARFLPQGSIEYLGRVDQQVKINGHRVELNEIEAKVSQYQGVKEAVVTLQQNDQGTPKLIAYYTGAGVINDAAFAAFLVPKLPYYMIPIKYVYLNQIPLNNNGKIDYAALPGVDFTLSSTYVPARNELETALVAVWEQILGSSTIGIYDNFFALGGDSIKAVQISARLHDRGIKLPSREILISPTIEQLAQRIERTKEEFGVAKQSRVEGKLPPWPIVSWFFSQQFSKPGYYNQSILLRFKKPIDPVSLAQAFQALIQKHDSLRLNVDLATQTLFYNDAHLQQPFVLQHYKQESLQTPQELLDAYLDQADLEFDLAGDLLIKAVRLSGAQGQEWLFITAHHLVVDGISWRILLHDLQAFYTSQNREEQQGLKTVSLVEWQAALTHFAGSYAHLARLGYWENTEKLSFNLPQKAENISWKAAHQALAQKRIAGMGEFLKESTSKYQLDAGLLLQAALLEALQNWTGQTRFVIMQENHGRHLHAVDVSATVGWFTAMYPVSWDWKGVGWADKLQSFKEQAQRIPEKGLGYGIWKYSPEQMNMPTPIPAIRFNYLGDFGSEANNNLFELCKESPGLQTHPHNTLTAQIDINVSLIEAVLQMEIGYNALAQQPDTIQWLLDAWIEELYALREFLSQNPVAQPAALMAMQVDLSEQELDELFQ